MMRAVSLRNVLLPTGLVEINEQKQQGFGGNPPLKEQSTCACSCCWLNGHSGFLPLGTQRIYTEKVTASLRGKVSPFLQFKMKFNFQKSGTTGLIVTVIGAALLAIVFYSAYQVYNTFFSLAQANFNSSSADFVGSLNSLLQAAIVVMFLGIMGWVGSIFLLRGVEFMKVDRGIGVVTFKVDKTVGLVSGIEVTGNKSGAAQQLDLSKAEQQ